LRREIAIKERFQYNFRSDIYEEEENLVQWRNLQPKYIGWQRRIVTGNK
jgi:hypothetical protein